MKFKVTMKDPDTLWDAIRDAVRNDTSINAADDEKLKIVRAWRITYIEAARPAPAGASEEEGK